MAYDPNDPADKKIFDDALAAQREELEAEHEAEVEGLKSKRDELLAKLRKARAGTDGNDDAEITRLEGELETANKDLREAKKDLRESERNLKTVTEDRDTLKIGLEKEQATSRTEFIRNQLTSELSAANVKPEFLEATQALLKDKVTVSQDGDSRKAVVGDKSLSDYVKEWSQGDQGKHYVGAGNNGGGGASGSSSQGGSKKIYEMTEAERAAAYKENPSDFDKRVAAGENVAPPKE